MASIHVLRKVDTGGYEYSVVVHWTVPAGNNSAGISWKAALVNAGLNKTSLPDGDGTGGTISAAEKASIVAGDVVETPGVVRLDSVTLANANAYLDTQVTRITAEAQSQLSLLLKFFGAAR